MNLRQKFRHWLANQLQVVVLLGWRKSAMRLWAYLKGQRVGVILGAVLVLLPMLAFGQVAPTTAQLDWTAPVQNTDGSALTKCATQASTGPCLLAFRAYHGTTEAAVQAKTDGRAINDRNATSYDWTGLTPGTHYFAVTALNGDGSESALSALGGKLVPAPVPLPPGDFTVQQDTTAYRMRQAVDGFEMVALGTVAPGTACKPDQSVNGYFVVPRDAVTLSSPFDTKPLITFARCG